MKSWTRQAIEKAAPDPSSLAAARRLARPGPWSELGSTDTLVWGSCQGSAKTPYQVSVDLVGPAYRCSCPSRKFPCKHALALLLLYVAGDGSVAHADAPADHAMVLAEQQAAKAAAESRPKRAPDPAARAKRQAERRELMSAGIADFSLWLTDLVRSGTAQARRQPWEWWDTAAARLVDAQLPGLADRVRTMASEINRRPDWDEHLLIELGRWWTVTRAWQSWDDLDKETRGDLRAYVGWSRAGADIRSRDAVTDHWSVLGAHTEDDGRLQQRRTWLRGETTGEVVQILDFAAGSQALPLPQLAGSTLEATLARYPGHRPRRALFVDDPIPVAETFHLGEPTDLSGAAAALADTMAGNPWAIRTPVTVRAAVRPAAVDPGDDDRTKIIYVIDDAGAALPLIDSENLWLLAITGGHPYPIFGEITAGHFRPLTVALEHRVVPV